MKELTEAVTKLLSWVKLLQEDVRRLDAKINKLVEGNNGGN
jgi:hypothetical protein